MADNNFAPSYFSPSFKNDSLENNPMRVFTHLENTISHTTTTQTSSNENMVDLPQDPREKKHTKSSSKKRKGRPQGSRNKPKARIIIEENTEILTEVVTIKIHVGEDIVEALINYAQRRQVSIKVSRAFGLVSDVTLLDPISCVPLLPIEGPLHMTSLFGTYLNPNCDSVPPQFIANPPCSSFTIYFSGINGQVFGGVVGGKVIAAGVVYINATLVKKIGFHRVISTKKNDRKIEEGGSIYDDGVINNADHESYNNNMFFQSSASFNSMGGNSTMVNHQTLPYYLPTYESLMPWNHSTHTKNF